MDTKDVAQIRMQVQEADSGTLAGVSSPPFWLFQEESGDLTSSSGRKSKQNELQAQEKGL